MQEKSETASFLLQPEEQHLKTPDWIIRLIARLKEIQLWFDLFNAYHESVEETAWTMGPGQTVLPNATGKTANFLNSGTFIVPVVILQALGYLAKVLLMVITFGLEEKYQLNQAELARKNAAAKKLYYLDRIWRPIKYTLFALAAIGVAVAILYGGTTGMLIACTLQAGIDIVRTSISLGKQIWRYSKYKAKAAALAITDPETIQACQAKLNQQKKQIGFATGYLGFACGVLVLTVLSCLPIPVISNIAQFALAAIMIGMLAKTAYVLVKATKEKLAAKKAAAGINNAGEMNKFKQSYTLGYILRKMLGGNVPDNTASNTISPIKAPAGDSNNITYGEFFSATPHTSTIITAPTPPAKQSTATTEPDIQTDNTTTQATELPIAETRLKMRLKFHP